MMFSGCWSIPSIPINCIENATDLPISCNWRSTGWPEILEFLLINVAFLANKKYLCKHGIVVHLTMRAVVHLIWSSGPREHSWQTRPQLASRPEGSHWTVPGQARHASGLTATWPRHRHRYHEATATPQPIKDAMQRDHSALVGERRGDQSNQPINCMQSLKQFSSLPACITAK